MQSRFITYLLCTFVIMLMSAPLTHADSAQEIDIKVDAALERFRAEVQGGERFLQAAAGVMVFPSVLKAGFGIGGEYGEGALRIGGQTVDYYSTAAASIGFQFGAQSKAVFVLFMDEQALQSFRNTAGWRAGVDGSINLIRIGAGASVDTNNLQDPVVGFVLTNAGLMYNLTLEGSKFTRLEK
ncbi:BPSL1445 family SYLF domain-containing lipoprotein [Pseudohongiella spirulinae]|uniref:Ysc84 actin-binding domain-containing protein n=1 Tax=Pseudohongiella spirulinae TaxID=1249552 RepID=A0A0S2K9I6_9GAMM|nr:YSC84-related protein [Pseudohongiella spirulinae]ALO45009.1 hypothetical protein PS2015_319 [Pseudohongiella spirulinae]